MDNKISKFLFFSKYSYTERLFIIGCILIIVAFAGILLSTRHAWIVNVVFIAIIVLIILTMIFSIVTGRVPLGNFIIFASSCCIAFPVQYVFGGGANSGAVQWIIVIMVFVFAVFRGWVLLAAVLITTATLGVVTYIGIYKPEMVTPLASQTAVYFNSSFTALFASLLTGWLFKFYINAFEKEKEKAKAQKDEIEKLNESQSNFFSSISHEIRTPINTIIGLNEVTLQDNSISEDIAENAISIQNASKILLALINDLLDLSKIESNQMEIIPTQYETSRLFSEIVSMMWFNAKKKGLQFIVKIGENIPSMLYGDEIRLKQVIINVLNNAIKYTEKGSVTLTVDGEKNSDNEFIIWIDVVDTGIGIRKENIPFIFNSFKRVEEKKNRTIEGTGLGLMISKQLITLMGGKITVDSIYTKGSRFHIEVAQKIIADKPIDTSSIHIVAPTNRDYQQAFEAPEASVLVVDDNDMNRMVVQKLLKMTQVKVDMASSGIECLEKTKQNRYDIILMDHEMPEMDGIQTLHKLRTQENGLCTNTPVIALTANAGSDMKAFYISQGFQAYIAKPIHRSLLEAVLMQNLPSDLVEKSLEIKHEDEAFHVSQAKWKKYLIITADCVCDLPEQFASEYDIRLMPCYIVTEEGRFLDTKEIDSDNLLAYIENNSGDKDIRTEVGTIEEYEEFFAEVLEEAETVVHISTSQSLSHGYFNAVKAAASFDNVHVVDSKSISCAMGLLAMQAAKMALAGKLAEEIVSFIKRNTENVSINFILPMLGTFKRSSKIPAIARTIENMFNVEPVFKIKNGRLKIKTILFGGYSKITTTRFVKNVLKGRKNIDPSLLIVAYSGCTAQERESLVADIKKYSRFDEIIVQQASATISANTGPKTFSLSFMKRKINKA